MSCEMKIKFNISLEFLLRITLIKIFISKLWQSYIGSSSIVANLVVILKQKFNNLHNLH